MSNTDLISAINRYDIPEVRRLTDNQIDVNVFEYGVSALQLAVLTDQTEIFELLLKAGANASIQNQVNGTTALHWTLEGHRSMSEEKEIMFEWLLMNMVDINVQDMNGNTALHKAVKHGVLHLVDELLGHGANCRIVNNLNLEPLYYAIRGAEVNEEGIESTLMQAGSNINKILSHGGTMLHEFVEKKAMVQILLLIIHGANYEIENSQGQSALQLALESGSEDMCTRIAYIIGRRQNRNQRFIG